MRCASLALSLVIVGCYRGGPEGASAETETGAQGSEGADGADDGGSDGSDDESDDGGSAIPAQPLHRLNRLEYNNTVRDLLGTDLRPADAFGPDPEANGFDNMAEQLGLSPALLDSYEEAARDVIANALDPRPSFSVVVDADALGVLGGYPVGNLWALTGNAATLQVDVPAAIALELVLDAGASTIGPAPSPTVTINVDGQAFASFTVEGTGANPVEHAYPIDLQAGPHTIDIVPTNFINDPVANTSNNVLVRSVQLRSLELTDGPGRARVYTCDPAQANPTPCQEEIIANFATRAWRRPVTDDERNRLFALLATVRGNGEADDAALRIVLRAIMISPKFVYRLRTAADVDADAWLDGYVLASRLSYFLWSSMPDDRLFDAAGAGSLATEEGLSEAVAWMLEDDKAGALLDGFAEQWLSTRHLATASPSPQLFPDFDEPLRAAMTAEARLFFGDFLDNGMPITSMVLPDFAYRNDRLAAHYGAAPVGSDETLRVAASGADRRGLLSLAAWLTAQSDAEHSSPIRRGQWVSDRLLCTPVMPPPAGVAIEPIEFEEGQSVREQLEQHRSDPACAPCHQLLDVLGIGFEEYDATGRFRLGQVDNLGELPDGTTFEGGAALGELYADSEVFAGCLTQKLYTYALGRPLQPRDASAVEAVASGVFEGGEDLPALIDAIVHTPAFRSPAGLDGED